MDDLWTKIKSVAGTAVVVVALLVCGATMAQFLNQPGGDLPQPKMEIRVPVKSTCYVLPGGYQDLLEVTLADGSVIITNGTAMVLVPKAPKP